MKIFMVFLLIFGVTAAFTVMPDYLGVQDTGNERLPQTEIGIRIDCESKDLLVHAASEGEPIEGVKIYLFYTDYGYKPLPTTGMTDRKGDTVLKVPGTLEFLTGLFIIRAEHTEFRTREVEFSYLKCFETDIPEDIPIEEPTEEPEEVIEAPEPEEITAENLTNNTHETPEILENTTEEQEDPETPETCPAAIVLLSLLSIGLKL